MNTFAHTHITVGWFTDTEWCISSHRFLITHIFFSVSTVTHGNNSHSIGISICCFFHILSITKKEENNNRNVGACFWFVKWKLNFFISICYVDFYLKRMQYFSISHKIVCTWNEHFMIFKVYFTREKKNLNKIYMMQALN